MRLHLKDNESTETLGRTIATAIQRTGMVRAIMFQGPLGSGKTTLIRALVESLPGGELAEVSSPSFNVYNVYPTVPPTVHYDLYRLEGAGMDESYYEFLDEGRSLLLVEWAEFLPSGEWPDEWLLFRWVPCDEGRLVEIAAHGPEATCIRNALTLPARPSGQRESDGKDNGNVPD
ncbi:tRNA (adenosine(37)-N6)-threonylcarbamoyltransferase complex ATPase subunit type 1 TsaE [Desulfovibrio psychrotolerans]|uniref:tRNA threonylcarbamoyladenosine biosynthesis protein TsaE n=1 Tax=Desulfovibrio psychrotolerans TaxID=415242 RepID=A0A7J0BQX4_9BACT|nr:tRNA (adenosine(37)-N6)-threonylcarbamoyltransferase complex ATPase subunit type 1 TsaE [Desulfovibrio psychrotolerans]GFM35572.1 tRNA (adenosine(37)-N6)-threonylcarbamoyltransferase complex ATPase subunit type 1 TsaE [Desulfovibrio psychrotolerans]